MRNGLSFRQYVMVKRAAAPLPPADRRQFFDAVMARLKPTTAIPCTDDAVEIAIGLALPHQPQQKEPINKTATQNG